MSKHAWWIVGLAALVLAFSPPALADEGGEEDAPRPAPARVDRGKVRGEADVAVGLPRDLAEMAKALDLSEQQKQDLQDKLTAKQDALAQWKKDNDSKIREAQEAIRKAQESLNALMEEQKKLGQAKDADVMAVFTPKQLATWEVMKVAKAFEGRGENQQLILKDDQKVKIKELCDEAVAELVALSAATSPAEPRAKQDILRKLHVTIYEKVLLDEQRPLAPKPSAAPKGGEGAVRGRPKAGEEGALPAKAAPEAARPARRGGEGEEEGD